MSEQFQQEPQEAPLPLEVRVQRHSGGWSARLPLRAEFVRVDKVVETRERVSVRAHVVRDVERLSDTVRREELRVDTEGNVNVDPRGAVDSAQRRER